MIRIINIALFWPILVRTGAGMDLTSAAATAWAGIRGFVGLMLALMVYTDADIGDGAYKLLCFFFMATTACLTIIVQGGVFELVLWVSTDALLASELRCISLLKHFLQWKTMAAVSWHIARRVNATLHDATQQANCYTSSRRVPCWSYFTACPVFQAGGTCPLKMF